MPSNTNPAPVEGARRLILTGFMGSGKTTVGRLLAARLGWRFADLDESIEELLGRSVPEIFAEKGEAAFRAAETDALRELLAGSRVVVALGGGAPEAPGLRDLLAGAPETEVIYLEGSFDALYARCARQALDPTAVGRPLLGSREDASGRYDRRKALYEDIATLRIPAEPGHPEEVVMAILSAIGNKVLLP